ncbi:MAG: YfhO family protein, partial [Planctomycetota bacterium]
LPRAFIATDALPPRTVGTLTDWDPLVTAATLADWTPTSPATETQADVVDWSNTHVSVDVKLNGDGFLILTDQHFPGWHATVDGEPVAVEKADGIFRGVPLEAGARRVEFRYRPSGMTAGAGLALFALLGLSLLARARGCGAR